MDPQYMYIICVCGAVVVVVVVYKELIDVRACVCGVMNDTVCSCDNGYYCSLCPILLTMGSL